MSIIEGLRCSEQKYQRFGFREALLFTANSFKPNLCNQKVGKCSKSIQGLAMKIKSGLCFVINLLRANLDG